MPSVVPLRRRQHPDVGGVGGVDRLRLFGWRVDGRAVLA